MGYGQHRPISPNDVEENRRHNRRVEITVTGKNIMNDLGDSLERYKELRNGTADPLADVY